MKDNNNVNTGLTADEISQFKALLQAKRNEILGDLVSMEDETHSRQRGGLSNMLAEMGEEGSDNGEIENTLGMLDSERKLLREIDEALGRIENGTYAICEGNGKPIPKVRLEAIPWAKYCVEYASMLEKGLVKRKYSSPSMRYDFGNDEEDDNGPRGTFRREAG